MDKTDFLPSRTSFKNCILKNANFINSNVKEVKFDEDCKLEGACFDEAVGLDSATIRIAGEEKSLLNFLDEKAFFVQKRSQKKKGISQGKRQSIFL
jgi:uncharacterized protein YjbI with pentapeptide repeats